LIRALRCVVVAGLCAGLAYSTAGWARGVSPYLPLNLSPEIERQIERVLILADKPVMSRPIAAATVLDALPAACRSDERLCRSVRRYLDRYMNRIGLGHASIEAALSDGAAPLPNARGMHGDSAWRASAQAYWQASDYAILSLGGVAYDDDASPAGSMLSVGFDFAQLDVGYRDHWLSPFTDGAMLISTQARTLPSVTLSNYRPLTAFGFQYEVFLAEMERSDRIRFGDGFTSGRPRLAGVRLAIEPAAGWSLGANRLVQFGGGRRGGSSFGDFMDALLDPSRKDNRSASLGQDEEFGNQVAAWTSRFIFPGPIPFAAYLEYAGEDTSYRGNYRLGNASLAIGLTFPRLWQRFDLTYEATEWQNGWYVHGLYLDGLTQDGHVLGHWGADERVRGDGVGAQTHMLRLGWQPPFGGLAQLRVRTVANESYTSFDYERGYDVTVAYSRALNGYTAGAEVVAGRDVFGETFGRLAGVLRFGDEWMSDAGAGWSGAMARPWGAELFVDAGLAASKVRIRIDDGGREVRPGAELAPHVAAGARRAVSERSDLGVRLELDRVDDHMLLAVRALDYRYRFHNRLAFGLFAGAARYDVATPAYGYYFGAGAQWRDVLPKLDLSLDLRYADKVARDKLLPGDPPADPRPDIFYDVESASLSLSYRF